MIKTSEAEIQVQHEINPRTRWGVRRFYTRLFDWIYRPSSYSQFIDSGFINKEIRYFSTEDSLTSYLMKNERFGSYCYDALQDYCEDPDEDNEEEVVKRNTNNLKAWATNKESVNWLGEGYYVSWDWSDSGESVKRIDDAYDEMMAECQYRIEQGDSSYGYNECTPTKNDIAELMKNVSR